METARLIFDIIISSGLIGMLFLYRSKKKKAAAEAEDAEFDVTTKQIDYLSKQLADMFTENDKMQELLDQKKAELLDIKRQLNEMKLRLLEEEYRRKEAEYNMCTVEQCAKRIPPRRTTNNG